MPYLIDTRRRWPLVEYHRHLTGSLIKVSLFLLSLVTPLLWVILFVFTSPGLLVGFTIFLTGLTLASWLLFTFGSTYFPYLPAPVSILELSRSTHEPRNLAAAASFDFLAAIGWLSPHSTATQFHHAVKHLLNHPANLEMLRRLQINAAKLLSILETDVLSSLSVSDFSRAIIPIALASKRRYLQPEHALAALLLQPSLSASLRTLNLTDQDVRFALWWTSTSREQRLFKRAWWHRQNLVSVGGLGLSWASGFTPFVDRFARIPPGNIWDDVLVGHEEKVAELINTLARQRQGNVLLVGDPGVGQIGLIRELARRVHHNQAHPALNGQRLIYLNMGEIISLSTNEAGQYANVFRALRELEQAGNIIAVIGGLSSILGQTGETQVNLTDLLAPFLSSKTVRVVVSISAADYHLRVKTNQELTQYFEVVYVPSLSLSATMQRVALTAPMIERKSGLFLPYKSIRTLVEDTSSILPHIPFPERAFDFLEEAIVYAQNQSARVLTEEHIHAIITRKIGVDLGQIKSTERKRLLDLESIMHLRLINQDQAVKAVSRALIRARAEVRNIHRPIGTFLFLGPTGVGKTETAKTLADSYFGSDQHLVRLDMSEFQGEGAVERIIGSSRQPVGRLTSLISEHPFAVLLLDEFEKAAEAVHQLFLQVFDEGRLTDAAGREYSFLHTIIIATSNAGAELIRETARDGKVPEGFDQVLKEHILRENILRPELLNRFDEVIIYSPLTADHIRAVARLMLQQLNQRLDAEHGVTVRLTPELIERLMVIGYDPQFGARPMARAIQDTVEYAVAQMVIRGDITPGQQITLPPELLTSPRG